MLQRGPPAGTSEQRRTCGCISCCSLHSHSLPKWGIMQLVFLQSLGKHLDEVPGFLERLMLSPGNGACRKTQDGVFQTDNPIFQSGFVYSLPLLFWWFGAPVGAAVRCVNTLRCVLTAIQSTSLVSPLRAQPPSQGQGHR